MKTLVTGGTGFTGSHLVKRLLDEGHEVRVLDNQKGHFYDELFQRGADMTIGSVTNKSLVDRQTKDCEVVYHLAAAFRQINVPRSRYWDVNVIGTRNIAAAAHQYRARKLVYCSTCGVHGNISAPPGDEKAPIAPEDYYQYTKYAGEKVVQEFVDQGLDAAIIRPAAIYGPGDPERFAMLFRLVQRGRFLMFGSGNTYYHPLYIDNLVDAFRLASDTPESCGQTYLIADEKYWSLNDLVKQVAQAMDVRVHIRHLPYWPIWCSAWMCEWVCKPFRISPPIFPRRVAWFRQDRAFSIEKARRELNYQPRIRLHEGLSAAADWYRQIGLIKQPGYLKHVRPQATVAAAHRSPPSMCGIAGIWNPRGVDPQDARAMAAQLHHRGPDEEGFFFADQICAGQPAAQHHRPEPRPATDFQRRSDSPRCLQRRNL